MSLKAEVSDGAEMVNAPAFDLALAPKSALPLALMLKAKPGVGKIRVKISDARGNATPMVLYFLERVLQRVEAMPLRANAHQGVEALAKESGWTSFGGGNAW